jgi:ferredoxin-NADP reductase
MDFARAQQFNTKVSDLYYLNDTHTYLLIKFELIEPDRIHFFAGQYVSLKVTEKGDRRSYSIVTTPDDDHGFQLVAEIIPNGLGSEFLKHLKPGDDVEVLAPLGRFVINPEENRDKKRLFVATGSGIAPINAMITDLLINRRETRPMRLHWGMRDEQRLFWFDNYERLSEEHSNFVFDVVLSQPSDEWTLCTGHVQDCLRRDFTPQTIVDWDVYVCGNPTMVEQVSELMQEMGLPANQFHHEKFTH